MHLHGECPSACWGGLCHCPLELGKGGCWAACTERSLLEPLCKNLREPEYVGLVQLHGLLLLKSSALSFWFSRVGEHVRTSFWAPNIGGFASGLAKNASKANLTFYLKNLALPMSGLFPLLLSVLWWVRAGIQKWCLESDGFGFWVELKVPTVGILECK